MTLGDIRKPARLLVFRQRDVPTTQSQHLTVDHP